MIERGCACELRQLSEKTWREKNPTNLPMNFRSALRGTLVQSTPESAMSQSQAPQQRQTAAVLLAARLGFESVSTLASCISAHKAWMPLCTDTPYQYRRRLAVVRLA
jgi:hypothetical protein